MSADFHFSEWGRDTLTFQLSIVDASPDLDDDSVYEITMAGQSVYFEAEANMEVWKLLDIAIGNLKGAIEMGNL